MVLVEFCVWVKDPADIVWDLVETCNLNYFMLRVEFVMDGEKKHTVSIFNVNNVMDPVM
jgi:hypothetical protein